MEIPTHLEFPKEAGKTICVVGITIYKHCPGFPSLMAMHSRTIALKSLSLSQDDAPMFWTYNNFCVFRYYDVTYSSTTTEVQVDYREIPSAGVV